MNYLLDTCVISDFVKGQSGTLQRIKQTSPSEIAVSTITVMEILYGLSLNPARVAKIEPIIHRFLDEVAIIEFNKNDAGEAAKIRAVLKKLGCPIGSYDVLLAGTALNRNLTLVSANSGEFQRIKGLRLENWR